MAAKRPAAPHLEDAGVVPSAGAASSTPPDGTESAGGVSCPACGSPLDLYAGDNQHKVGTGFCSFCGLRIPLP